MRLWESGDDLYLNAIVRRQLRVRGRVQGVGFRPFVYRLATDLGLSGWVRNDAGGVTMEVQGEPRAFHCFLTALRDQAPPLAWIERIEAQELAVQKGSYAFRIEQSVAGIVDTGIPADAVVCEDCLAELFHPADRRYRYPFINCMHCGPRFTIVRALPYDRHNTAMAPFDLCAQCQREYELPSDRRFHAEPQACAACGPQLALWDATGTPDCVPDVIAGTWQRLNDGAIVAIKGLGGFHLVCDAGNRDAVRRLRQSKGRFNKPLALMVANTASLDGIAHVNEEEKERLTAKDRPIVLLRKKSHCDDRFPGAAPGLGRIGVMLPYTPIHYLLFHEAAGHPQGSRWWQEYVAPVFVCTSANRGNEPIAIANEEVVARLRGLADAFVVHNREILARCDDSVVRVDSVGPTFVRRGRGRAPEAIGLSAAGPSVLAVGGMQKDTICLTRHDEAFLSPHIGDLDSRASYEAFEETIARLMEVLGIEPERVAHDLHPDYPSTLFAEQFAAKRGLPCVPVQHHHAHIAAVVAEHGLAGPVLGVALDGAGYGGALEIWGGELLLLDGAAFTRLGSLGTLRLPGGDRAAREPWRMAAASLHALGCDWDIVHRFKEPGAAIVAQMLKQGFHAPLTSSAGRLFDAAAGLLGVCLYADYEGQAAMMLEGMAEQHGEAGALTDGYEFNQGNGLSFLPLLDFLRTCEDPFLGAAVFHATLVAGMMDWVMRAGDETGVRQVAFGGGCLINGILRTGLHKGLGGLGMETHSADLVPPNDGGLCLGQAWVAMHTPLPGGLKLCV